jgi:hypothetical protein
MDPLIKQMIDSLYSPLKFLDYYIKDLPYTNNTYKYGINFLAYILGPLIIDSRIYYYVFVIIPRLILLTALYIDVFHFNKLVYIYKVLLIGVVLLIGKYIIYSFKYAKEHFIESLQYYVSIGMDYEYAVQVVELDTAEEDDIPPTMVVPLPIFVEFQTDTYIMKDSYYDYMSFFNPRNDTYYIKHHIPVPRQFGIEEINTRINNILKISLILAHYELLHNNENIKNLKILIYLNYLLCWGYILITSLPSLYNVSLNELWYIFAIQNIEEPFSLTKL